MQIVHKSTRHFTGPLIGLAALALLGLAPTPASAQRAVLTATGTLQSVYDPQVTLDSTATVGARFTLTYVFDYVPADTSNSNSNYNEYFFTRSGTGATVTFGDYTVTPGGYLNVASVGGSQNTPPRDGITFQTGGETVSNAGTSTPSGASTDLQLIESGGRVVPGNALPLPSAYQLTDFVPYSQDSQGTYFFTSLSLGPNADLSYVRGSIDTLGVQFVPAPEPSQPAALGLGVLILGALTLTAHKRRSLDA